VIPSGTQLADHHVPHFSAGATVSGAIISDAKGFRLRGLRQSINHHRACIIDDIALTSGALGIISSTAHRQNCLGIYAL